MHIALAPFKLKHGVAEETLLNTSDEFENLFVRKQDGILRRILVRDHDGGYADIVFFEDEKRSSASWTQSNTAKSARRSSRSWTTTAHTACSRSSRPTSDGSQQVPLKDQLFNRDKVAKIATSSASPIDPFNVPESGGEVTTRLPEFKLEQRSHGSPTTSKATYQATNGRQRT